MMYYILPTDKDLKHHGILGMHWGVRKYQNKDGSYTNAGKKRYSSAENKEAKRYNYKDSDRYKKASSFEKTKITNSYNARKRFLGRKAANRIEYKIDKYNADGREEAKKEAMKQLVPNLLIAGGIVAAAPHLLKLGANSLGKFSKAVQVGSAATGAAGQAAGLNGGFNALPIKELMSNAEIGKKLLLRT